MRVFIPTYVRVGSTWVSEIVQSMREIDGRYHFVTFENHEPNTQLDPHKTKALLDSLGYTGGAIKCHSAAPQDFSSYLKQNPEDRLIVVKRNFFDTFLSKFMYERYSRPESGLPIGEPIKSFIEEFPAIPDDAGINLFIETHLNFIRQEIKMWYVMSQSCASLQCLTVNYDKVRNGNTVDIYKQVGNFLGVDELTQERSKERCEFASMKKRHKKHFIRKGVVGDYKNYFDPQTVDMLLREINNITQRFQLNNGR